MGFVKAAALAVPTPPLCGKDFFFQSGVTEQFDLPVVLWFTLLNFYGNNHSRVWKKILLF